jgi:hypothetical protein
MINIDILVWVKEHYEIIKDGLVVSEVIRNIEEPIPENSEFAYGGYYQDNISSLNFKSMENLMLGVTPKGISYYSPYLFYGSIENFSEEDIEIMQYIGKNDRDDKKIYNNFIVNFKRHGLKKWETGVIKYNNYNCHYFIHCHYNSDNKGGYYGVHFSECEEIEIVGSIFEYPKIMPLCERCLE